MSQPIPLNINLDVDPNVDFEPGMFSIPELHFALEHLREPPVASFSDFSVDTYPGVQRARLEPVLEKIHEFETVRQHRGVEWIGFDAIQDSIERFLQWHDRSEEIRRRSRGTIVNPSQFHWDDTGARYKYAIGADSAEMVRHEILDSGERKPFKVRMTLKPEDALAASVTDLMPWVMSKKGLLVKDAIEIQTAKRTGTMRCSVCGHSEEFQSASQQAKAGARGRMVRHLKAAKEEMNRHRILLMKFTSGK